MDFYAPDMDSLNYATVHCNCSLPHKCTAWSKHVVLDVLDLQVQNVNLSLN